jgi:hypothetical protein
MKIVHAEIEYQKQVGESTWVHSDICPKMCKWENLDEKHRKYLHDCLDEWLDNSGGSGQFYIEEEGYREKRFKEDLLEEAIILSKAVMLKRMSE